MVEYPKTMSTGGVYRSEWSPCNVCVPGGKSGDAVVVVVVELAPDERLLVLGLGVRRRSLLYCYILVEF